MPVIWMTGRRCTRPNPVNEFGGLGEALYQLYDLTKDPVHLETAHPIIGGVSEQAEHWGRYGEQGDALTGGESESCCAHNAERILSRLFVWTQDPRLLDRLAVLKYNAVLNCASPETGLSQYHQPMGELVHKTFSGVYDTFWCCTASGVEAMSELQKNIWFLRDDGGALLLNVWIPSQVRIPQLGLHSVLPVLPVHCDVRMPSPF